MLSRKRKKCARLVRMTARRLMNVTVERGLTKYGKVIEMDVEEDVEEDVEDVEEAAGEADEVDMTITALGAAQETGLGILDGAIEVVDLV